MRKNKIVNLPLFATGTSYGIVFDGTTDFTMTGGTLTALGRTPTFIAGSSVDLSGDAALGFAWNSMIPVQAALDAGIITAYGGDPRAYIEMTQAGGYDPIVLTAILLDVTNACCPEPADGTLGNFGTSLSWLPGERATAHTVYLGTSPDNLTVVAGPIPATSYTPPVPFDIGETYFWRVDETAPGGPYTGDLWSFTVRDYILIDDFEAYDANTVTASWPVVDNSVINLTTQTIPIQRQAMSLAYDTSSLSYSEVTRMIDSNDPNMLLDGSEARALELWVKGNGTNVGDKLYVLLKDDNDDTAIAFFSDADLTDESWQQCRIDLATLTGIDLAIIDQISIGAGDRNAAAAGGLGTIYIDNIALHPELSPSVGTLHPDLNDDNNVNLYDFVLLAYDWLNTDIFGGRLPGNVSDDWVVDSVDLGILSENWLDSQETILFETPTTIGIENGLVKLEFSKTTGGMLSLINLVTGDDYLKETTGGGNPFRGYIDTTLVPPIATLAFPWDGPMMIESDTLGGTLTDPKNCQLFTSSFQRSGDAGVLSLELRHGSPSITFELTVKLFDGDVAADFDLTVKNTDNSPHNFVTAFPYFTGLGLGADRSTNLSLRNVVFGIPGVEAWVSNPRIESGGICGNTSSYPWQAVYEPDLDEGFGIIPMDPDFKNKICHRFPYGMSVLYYPKETLAAGQEVTYPTARIMVYQGTWRPVARRYGQWFHDTFDVRQPPEWLKKIDASSGVTLDAENPVPWTGIPEWFQHAELDAVEWALWNDDDDFLPRVDSGTHEEMRQGIAAANAVGRYALLYIHGVTRWEESVMWQGYGGSYDPLDFAVQYAPGQYQTMLVGPQFSYFMCTGYDLWQDHLAMICARAIQETGANGIRLDQVGAVPVPCYNPVHNHDTPFDAVKWGVQLMEKVRNAMDVVDPNALLLTEGPMDFYSPYTNGAFSHFTTGYDFPALCLAIPEYKGFELHGGHTEAALEGTVTGPISATRNQGYPWQFIKDVPDFLTEPGPDMEWNILRSTFADAIANSRITDVDPYAPNDPKWAGRLWTSDQYYMMTGGYFDASELDRETLVKLPELPSEIRFAFEIDIIDADGWARTKPDLDLEQVPLIRNDDGIFVIVNRPFSAVLLPKPNCPPMVIIEEMPEPIRGETVTMDLHAFAPWGNDCNSLVNVEIVNFPVTPSSLTLPGSVQITAPLDAPMGIYDKGRFPINITGACLPTKSWMRVIKQ